MSCVIRLLDSYSETLILFTISCQGTPIICTAPTFCRFMNDYPRPTRRWCIWRLDHAIRFGLFIIWLKSNVIFLIMKPILTVRLWYDKIDRSLSRTWILYTVICQGIPTIWTVLTTCQLLNNCAYLIMCSATQCRDHIVWKYQLESRVDINVNCIVEWIHWDILVCWVELSKGYIATWPYLFH